MASLYRYSIKAGVPTFATVAGKLVLVDNIDGADSINITLVRNAASGNTMTGRKKAFKCWADYDSVILEAAQDCIVDIWLSNSDVSLGFADGALVNVAGGVSILNDPDSRIPVNVDGGVINVTASVETFEQLLHPPKVAVGTAAAVVVSDNNTLKRLRFRNVSQVANIALGGPAVDIDSPLILAPGDSYTEEDAAGAKWYAIADAANAQLSTFGMK
jgi:hypothetical protein